MCKPFEATEPKLSLYHVRSEIHSACSSLHMPDYPLENAEPNAFFMTEKYEYVHHAREHLHAALNNGVLADKSLRNVYFRMRRLGINRKDITVDELADAILDLAEELYEIL